MCVDGGGTTKKKTKLVNTTVFYPTVDLLRIKLTDVAGRAAPTRSTLALVALTGLGAAAAVGAGVGQAGVLGWSLLGGEGGERE